MTPTDPTTILRIVTAHGNASLSFQAIAANMPESTYLMARIQLQRSGYLTARGVVTPYGRSVLDAARPRHQREAEARHATEGTHSDTIRLDGAAHVVPSSAP